MRNTMSQTVCIIFAQNVSRVAMSSSCAPESQWCTQKEPPETVCGRLGEPGGPEAPQTGSRKQGGKLEAQLAALPANWYWHFNGNKKDATGCCCLENSARCFHEASGQSNGLAPLRTI